ncbi:MAG: nitroreductase [Rudaea sp.]
MDLLDLIDSRHSTPTRQLGPPGPSPQQLERLLVSAIRVPDHGKLVPWRLLTIAGDARIALGESLAQIHQRKEPDISPAALDKDRERYTFAPLIVAVIARVETDHPKVPVQEQILSAGCVAHNLLLCAHAMGFGAQWLTGWAAYDADAAALFGLSPQERIVAFVHIGTPRESVPERNRPALDEITGEWHP